MTVQANPNALAAPGRALAQLGDTAFRISASFYEAEKKAERAGQVAGRVAQATKAVQDFVLDPDNQNRVFETNGQASSFFDTSMAPIRMMAMEGVTDPRVKSQIATQFSTIYESSRLGFMKIARNNLIDRNIAKFYATADGLKERAAIGSPSEVNAANIELFENYNKQGVGLYDYMAQLGLIDEQTALKNRKSAGSDIAQTQVNSELNSAALSGNAELADQVILKLLDPKEYEGLDAETRTSLTAKATSLSDKLFRRAVTAAEKAETKTAKDLKKRQETTERDFFARFRAGSMENATDAQIQAMPTELDISEALTFGEIRQPAADALIKLVRGGDAPVDDAQFVTNIQQQILAQDTEAGINELVDTATAALGPNGKITQGSLEKVISLAESAKAKTPEVEEIKRYEQVLNKLLQQDAGFQAEFDFGEQARRADALATYFELTSDPDMRLSGKEAYNQVRDMFGRSLNQKLNFLAPATLVREAVGKPASQWLPEDILKAQLAVGRSDLNQVQKALEYETIGEIESIARKNAQALREAEDAAATTEDQDGRGLFDFIKEWLKGDDDRLRTS
jgi:hypothetical protein